MDDPSLLVGAAGFEDAGVVRLDSETALVLTTDFFPPIVDDARWFGRIAAANALSDVFAMGGKVVAALNLVGWPEALDRELLGEMLAGGLEKIREAGGVLAGGHSVKDSEVKYGLAVTGTVHPERYWSNATARVGDALLLTKPLGMGAVSTALKKGLLEGRDDLLVAAMTQMATLNRIAAEVLADFEVHAATDVTGYGLAGHAREMADNAGVTMVVRAGSLPVFEGASGLVEAGAVSGGGKRARASDAAKVGFSAAVPEPLRAMVFDAETSGGLLVALPAAQAERAAARLRDAGAPAGAVVGEVGVREDVAVRIDAGT